MKEEHLAPLFILEFIINLIAFTFQYKNHICYASFIFVSSLTL